jgi:hypothetical protein
MSAQEFLEILERGGVVEDSSGIRWRLDDCTFMTSRDEGQTWEKGGYLPYLLGTLADAVQVPG